MLRLISIFVIAYAMNASAHGDPERFVRKSVSESIEFLTLLNSVKSAAAIGNAELDLLDFRNKAQRGLDFMCPGTSVNMLKCSRLIEWNETSASALNSFIRDLRKDDDSEFLKSSIEEKVSGFRGAGARFAVMEWEVKNRFGTRQITSVAVFGGNCSVLFDTELVGFVAGIRPVTIIENDPGLDNNSPNSASVVTNQRTSSITYNYWVDGTLGSVRHYNYVRATAIVPPYITAATNDAFFNFETTQITVERRDIDPLAPPTDPCVYFGTGGTIANTYSNAVPFANRVYLSNTNDRFNNGIYQVAGANGHNWSFTFDFSVTAGPLGLGIVPHQTTPDFTLSSPNFSEVKVNNYVYYYALGNTYRALFYDGGSLGASNFKILTGQGDSEVGSVNVSLPLQIAYWSYLILYTYSNTGVALNLSNVQYLRGDHVRQPTYRLSSTRYSIPVGQIDTLKARVTNNSSQVKLKGGSVSINVASLGDRLTLLSPATIAIDSINTNSYKEYRFVVRGNTNGVVTPQANVSSVGWTWPVPPDVVINNIFSIDSNITVGLTSVSQTSVEIPADYSVSQNYPNPFNPNTRIDFAIPRSGLVKVVVYDMAGREVQTLVNEYLTAGYYNTDFEGSALSSGVYIYRVQSFDFSTVKKMTLVK